MKALLALFALSVGSLAAASSMPYSGSNPASSSYNNPNGQNPAQQVERRINSENSNPYATPSNQNNNMAPNGQLNPNNTVNPNGTLNPADRSSSSTRGYANNGNNYNRNPSYTAEIETQMQTVQANTKYPQDTASTFKDKEINNKIRAKIEGWFADDYKGVILKTDNGIVILSGTVETQDLSNDLSDQVKKIDGVKEVRNNVSAVKANNSK